MSRVKIHTAEQPDSDTTTFVLSCNRLDVLDQTLRSFFLTRDYVTKMVIVDDSAEPMVFEQLVEKYGRFCDVICFPRNRSQWWAMDFMVSYCDSHYIFYLEDDWQFLSSGYLNKSKEILEKYRDIGTVDISWRTFEEQGIDSYEKALVDSSFYYKKLWRISDYHLHWYGWVGSPNLKRRDDLILLGRVEKWHNEWNIDRRFLGLGFKSVFLNGKYVEHLGDNCSRQAGKRPNDGTTPEDYYPKDLKKNRTYPVFDYLQWDRHWRHPFDITLVTAMIDIDRSDRGFEHYLDGISHILKSRHQIVMFCESKYFERIRSIRGNNPITLIDFSTLTLEQESTFNDIQNIITSEEWINQSPWMKNSVIGSRYYIPLTLQKHSLLTRALEHGTSTYYYWIDAGLYNSYNIEKDINSFYFTKIPKEKFFMTSFDYYTESEVHGYSVKGFEAFCGGAPGYVCRASLFGGTREQITKVGELYEETVRQSLDAGFIGAEEAIYTIMSVRYPEMFNIHRMPTGDVYRNFIAHLK